MPSFFTKLQTKHLIHTGVIFVPEIIDREEYNRLYEHQWTGMDEAYWLDFKHKYNLKFKLLENLEDIDYTINPVCVWFFRERPDTAEYKKYCKEKNLDPYKDFIDIKIAGNNIGYLTNTLLITNKKLELFDNEFVIRRPCVQIDLRSANITARKKIKTLFARDLG